MLAQQHPGRPGIALRRGEPAREARDGALAVAAHGRRSRTGRQRNPSSFATLLRRVCQAALFAIDALRTGVWPAAGTAGVRSSAAACSARRSGAASRAGTTGAARAAARRRSGTAAAAPSAATACPSAVTAAARRSLMGAFTAASAGGQRRARNQRRTATAAHEVR